MTQSDQRMFGRTLINRRLAAHAREQLELGREPLDDEAEAELAQAIHDRLFGLGVLQRLLDDETIENIDANGADQRVDHPGRRHQGAGPGRRRQRRRADRPAPHDRGPGGPHRAALRRGQPQPQRPAAGRQPALRRHGRHGPARRSPSAATASPRCSSTTSSASAPSTRRVMQFLAAAVRARKNMIVCGGVDAGKTTMLRALHQRDRARASASSPSRTTSSSASTATPTSTPTSSPSRPARRTSRARARCRWPIWCAGACA